MPKDLIPKGTPADHTALTVNGREVNVSVSAAKSQDVAAQAHLIFQVNENAAFPGGAFRSHESKDEYVGVVNNSDADILLADQVSEATKSALLMMGEDGIRSASFPVSPILSKVLGLSTIDLITSILEGVREYTKEARTEESPDIISDIVIAAGAGLYIQWTERGKLIDDILRPEGNEDKDAIVLLKNGTYDLSSHGIYNPLVELSEEQAISLEPDELQREWLETIGRELVEVTDSMTFHRNSPTAPVLPNDRKVIVTFDAETGQPISLQSGYSVPPPDQIASGEAAILVHYFESGGTGHLRVGREVVVSDAPANPEALRSIAGIWHFAPIIPSANVDVIDMGDGSQLIQPDIDVDELNRKFVGTVFNPEHASKMTVLGESVSLSVSHLPLARYLAQKTGAASTMELYHYFGRLSWGHAQYDFYIEEHGLFVGATMHRNWKTARAARHTMSARRPTTR